MTPDFIDKRLASPMWSDGWYYGHAAALAAVEGAAKTLHYESCLCPGDGSDPDCHAPFIAPFLAVIHRLAALDPSPPAKETKP